MKALLVTAGGGGLALGDVPEPPADAESLLVEAVALGVCGTDLEIVRGDYGSAPPGRTDFVLGHESLGRVLEAPDGSGFAPGDMVAGIVRRPDPVPCASCAVGEWDMCRNGRYTERGIKGLDGFGAQRYRLRPGFAVHVDRGLGFAGVLLEPTSVVAKAWQQIERIGRRARWSPRRVLVTGAGPIGLLAALLGVQRGLEVHVLDRVTDGPKPRLAAALGAVYHTGDVRDVGADIDVLIECTGASQLIFDAMSYVVPNGIVCLAGVSSGHRTIAVDAAALNREMVLENTVVFGTVNANRDHYELAARALADADRDWLHALISRRVPLDRWNEAFEKRPDDVKVAVEFAGTLSA